MEEVTMDSKERRRQAMPVVSGFVDQLRQVLGAELVDRQMAVAQQARREHAQVLAQQGEAAARRWHKANAHRCTFFAEEGGRTVGMASPYGQAGGV